MERIADRMYYQVASRPLTSVSSVAAYKYAERICVLCVSYFTCHNWSARALVSLGRELILRRSSLLIFLARLGLNFGNHVSSYMSVGSVTGTDLQWIRTD